MIGTGTAAVVVVVVVVLGTVVLSLLVPVVAVVLDTVVLPLPVVAVVLVPVAVEQILAVVVVLVVGCCGCRPRRCRGSSSSSGHSDAVCAAHSGADEPNDCTNRCKQQVVSQVTLVTASCTLPNSRRI